jgi:outer membrane protein assembly factor BamB
LNAVNGELRWRFRTGGPIVASPTIEDGIVYIGSMDNKLYALPVDAGR